jgi:hypothetical protein
MACTSANTLEHLSPTSTDVGLCKREDFDSFMASLMDSFWANTQNSVVHILSRILNERFAQAGRRPFQASDPVQEALMRVIIAIACINTDSPALIGQEAPRFGELQRGVDLSLYGKRRQETSIVLVNQALAVADAQGLFRQQTPDALALMILLADLQRHVYDDYAKGSAHRESANLNNLNSLLSLQYTPAFQPSKNAATKASEKQTSIAWSCAKPRLGLASSPMRLRPRIEARPIISTRPSCQTSSASLNFLTASGLPLKRFGQPRSVWNPVFSFGAFEF